MDQPVVIAGLMRKRAELAAAVIAADALAEKLRADIASVDVTLRMFDPEAKPDRIRPRARRGPTKFKAGEFTRAVLKALREAGRPLNAREIAAVLAEEHELDVSTAKESKRVVSLVRAALARPRQDLAKRVPGGDLLTWAAV